MSKDFKPKGITDEKKQKVSELSELFKNSSSVAFVNYTGLGVKAQQDFKKKLKDAGGKMNVYKNTFIRIAGIEAGFSDSEFNNELFSGQTAVISASDDPVSPIQITGEEIKENEILEFKAGILDGQFFDKDGIIKISKLPGKDQLQANAIGAIAGPLYGLVGTLQGNLQKLLFILEQAKEKAGSGEPAAA